MRIEEMNEGVQILLERMKTNPEEFETPFGKWQHIIDQIMGRKEGVKTIVPFLYDEEINALFEGLRNMERNKFTADILRGLADVTEEGEQLNLPYVRAMMNPPKRGELSMATLSRATKNLMDSTHTKTKKQTYDY
jgi:hypothetical protein